MSPIDRLDLNVAFNNNGNLSRSILPTKRSDTRRSHRIGGRLRNVVGLGRRGLDTGRRDKNEDDEMLNLYDPQEGEGSSCYDEPKTSESGEHNNQDTYDPSFIDQESRNRLLNRIEGFGSPTRGNASSSCSTGTKQKSIKGRIRRFRESQTHRMPIDGEQLKPRRRIRRAVEHLVVDWIDELLPAGREESSSVSAEKDTKQRSTKSAISYHFRDRNNSNKENHPNEKEDEDNDEVVLIKACHLLRLEKELRFKELELNAWKQRAKDLEIELCHLKGHVEDKSSSDGSSCDSGDDGAASSRTTENEIEWQTEAVMEGDLLNIHDDNDKESEGSIKKTEVGQKRTFFSQNL